MTDSRLICVGSYNQGPEVSGAGLSVLGYRAQGGVRFESVAVLDIPSPSWLEWHPTRRVVYATNEVPAGSVTAVLLDERGHAEVLDVQSTGGADPCHAQVTGDGRFLIVANYTGGTVAVFALDADGRMTERTDVVQHDLVQHGSGPLADRQQTPHPHMVVLTADGPGNGRGVSVVDLGTDSIHSYRLSGSGRLLPVAISVLPPGSGPRQLVRQPGTSTGYVVAELAGSLIAVEETALGEFAAQAPVLASSAPGVNLVAQLTLTADGRIGYLSNRGPNSISVFDLSADVPELLAEFPVGSGWPRHFALVDDRLLAADQDGGALLEFEVRSGGTELVRTFRFAIGTPTCVAVSQFFL